MPSQSLRIGFVTGSESWLRARGLAAKRLKMRLEGVVYPDVYSLPLFVADGFDFVRDGTELPRGRYDLLFAELNRSRRQLEYLDRLIDSGCAPLAVIPGPPELLESGLTPEKLAVVRRVLEGAAAVWAYAEGVRTFVDGLLGRAKARVIPWPFDAAATRRIGRVRERSGAEKVPICIGSPLRFSGVDQSYPLMLKAALQDSLAALPPGERSRFTFHAHVYHAEDREAFARSGFAKGLPVRLERKRGYASFLRYLAGCGGVINLTGGTILGRITFLAAALERPGLFSDNAELNRALYPESTVALLDEAAIGERVGALLRHAVGEAEDARFHPSAEAVATAGDYPRNARLFRSLAEEALAGTAASGAATLAPRA